jgi:membrane dipeptidase
MPLLVDSHEDLAWNILNFGRDYTRAATETRRIESGSVTAEKNGSCLLGWPDYQQGRVAVAFSTLFALPIRKQEGDWERLVYRDDAEANRLYWDQLEAYEKLVDQNPDRFRMIGSIADLDEILAHWASEPIDGHPVGLVPLMEGADGIRAPGELEEWWAHGLRAIGPAWAGTRFCGGTREPGPLTNEGHELLAAMAEFPFTLDISHMDQQAVLQALDTYPGPIIASHSNALALLPGSESNRHLSDRVIHGLIERDGIIGVVPYNLFLKFGWKKGEPRAGIGLEQVAAHIDHICQIAGDARHAALGTDFDGGFGVEATPEGIDTIASLQALEPILADRGYTQDQIDAIFGGNWIRHLKANLPPT